MYKCRERDLRLIFSWGGGGSDAYFWKFYDVNFILNLPDHPLDPRMPSQVNLAYYFSLFGANALRTKINSAQRTKMLRMFFLCMFENEYMKSTV